MTPVRRSKTKRYGLIALALGCAAFLAAFLFAWSGVYSVAASRGHWAVVDWFLHFGLRSSVRTHSAGIEVPALDHPAMVAAGIGHYEIACAECHGAPGQTLNPITLRMLPSPPYLPARIERWKPEQLFWITKHGLKFTGMPGWAAQGRDDEVWSVVAALVRLPRLDAAGYRELVGRDTPSGPEDQAESMRRFVVTGPSGGSLVACARCHGVDGDGGGSGAFPRLAGQSADYMRAALADYANGTRPSGIMGPIAAALTQEEQARVADFYAARTGSAARAEGDTAASDAGRTLAAQGDPGRGVAACGACHATEPGAAAAISPLYPRLAGQHEWYLRQQLKLWRDGGRSATPLSKIMAAAVRTLTDADIDALAAYYASLPPRTP